MRDDKWTELLDRLEDKFKILDRGEEALEDVPNGKVEFVIFESPTGTMMVERTTKPKTLGVKSFGGSKYGAGSNVEKIYSGEEMVNTLQVYKSAGDDWEPVEIEL